MNDQEIVPIPPYYSPQRPVILKCPRCHTRKIDKGWRVSFPNNSHCCPACNHWWKHSPDWTVATTYPAYILITLTNWLLRKKWITRDTIGNECQDTLDPLLRRFILFKSKRLGGIFLHQLIRSDAGSMFHDHPWPFVSILLSSGYTEETREGKKTHRPGAILIRPANWQHKVEINVPAWTLIFAGPQTRDWGFWTIANQFLPWQNYDAAAELCPEDQQANHSR
jgi:hypothetical protein